MRDVRGQIVAERVIHILTTFVPEQVAQGKALDGEVDDRRVLLGEESVAGKPPDVQEQEAREASDLERPPTRPGVVGHRPAIVLRQQGGQGDLGDDVLLQSILVEGGRRRVEGENQELGPGRRRRRLVSVFFSVSGSCFSSSAASSDRRRLRRHLHLNCGLNSADFHLSSRRPRDYVLMEQWQSNWQEL